MKDAKIFVHCTYYADDYYQYKSTTATRSHALFRSGTSIAEVATSSCHTDAHPLLAAVSVPTTLSAHARANYARLLDRKYTTS
jgi:hypothetical protein